MKKSILIFILIILFFFVIYFVIGNKKIYLEELNLQTDYNGIDFMKNNILVCFWTGYNNMSKNRYESFLSIKNNSKCKVLLITPKNLNKYILKNEPLHPAFQYLSETHKADYLRTYFMNFYGGGYTDIKKCKESYVKYFSDLLLSDKWICGYREINPEGVAFEPLKDKYMELIGNGAYICKPQTKLTNEWYNTMINLLDEKYELLKIYPAQNPQDSKEKSNYPIEWNEMLGRIFHRLIYKYKDKVLYTLPAPDFNNYR